MCFDANGAPPKNQTEFDQNFNSSTGIGPGMVGFGRAIVNAQSPQPTQPAPFSAPASSPTPSPMAQAPVQPAPAQAAPFQSAYKAPTSVADTFKQSAPKASSSSGSGRVVN